MTVYRSKIVHSHLICLITSAFVVSLAGPSAAQTYYPPPDSQGGWRTAKTAEEVRQLAGLDLDKLEEVFADYSRSTKNGGLLIVRHGWLAFEKYFGYGCRDAKPNLGSCGKSFTSIAVGILMAEHPDLFPDGLDQKIFTPTYLPPEAFPLSDPAKAEIKLGQLLAFSAGIRGNNPGLVRGRRVMLDPPGPDGWQAMVDEVVVGKRDISINGRNTSAKTLWCEPGEGYSYATASAHLASMIVRHISGMELEPYVRMRLAEPMGWGPFTFAYKHAKEVTHTPGGGGIALRATDMLRFCYLLLHEGRWEDRQLVPAEYVRHCGRKSPYNPHTPYSLQFNVNSDGDVPGVPRDAFWKTGSGGHVLYVVPSLDLIVWKLAGRDSQYKPSDTGVPMAEESVKGDQQRRGFKPAGQISSMQLLQDIVDAVVVPAPSSGNSTQTSSNTTDRKLIFKKSHIAAWMDEPDSYKMCDVDVLIQDMSMVSDADAERWGRFIDKMHAKGKLVCAEMRPATHMNELLEYVMTDDSLQAAACIDIQGKPIEVPWMVGHIYKGRTPVFLCSNQPRYRQFLRDQVRYFMKAGADGIMVDDGGGSYFAFNRGGCFCKHCMEGFRDYLSRKYSAGQLKRKGIHDIDSFDYRQFILQREGGARSYQNRKERPKIPFTSDFHDFLVHSDVELFRELQKLSCELAGKHIPMGWDNVDFGGLRAGYYSFWDVFYSEINYQHFGVDGRIPDTEFSPGIIMLDKFSDAMGKWYIPTPAPRSWEAIMKNDFESLLRLWVAFSYANGSALRYPRKGWIFSKETPWYFPPKEDFEPLYAFIREHRELFDDYEAVEQVGVLFTQNRGGGASRYYTPLKHVCASLVELNMPFGMAVAGDELLANRLKGDEAEQFELMLIPEPIRLIDGQQDIVNRWKERGHAVSVKREDDIAKKIGDRVKPLVAVEDDSGIWLFPRYIPDKPDAPVVCHVVNPHFDLKQDTAIPRTNVQVRMLRRLFGDKLINKVTYYTPENEPHTLSFDIDGDNIRVTIPRVDLWGILVFDNSAQWSETLNGKTINKDLTVEGKHRFVTLHGLTGFHPTSLHTKAYIETQLHQGDKGTISFWFSPLEDLDFFPNAGNRRQEDKHVFYYPFISDVFPPNNAEEMNFGIFWYNHDPQILGKFASGGIWTKMDYTLPPYVTVEKVPMHADCWYHLVMTWDKDAKKIELYLNGALMGYNHEAAGFLQSNDRLYVGRPMVVMRDLKLMDRVLPSKEIKVIRTDMETQVVYKNPWGEHLYYGVVPKVERNKWIKIGNRLQGSLDGKVVFDITDDPHGHTGPVFNFGHIGLRHMYHTAVRYRNLVVYERNNN